MKHSKCCKEVIRTVSMDVASNQHKIPGKVNLVYIVVLSSHSVCNETQTYKFVPLVAVRYSISWGNLVVFLFSGRLTSILTYTVEYVLIPQGKLIR